MSNLMQGDCLERMKEMPECSVDITVTSPPYDNLRTYNGNNAKWGEHVWKAVLADLYRVRHSFEQNAPLVALPHTMHLPVSESLPVAFITRS